MTSRRISVTLDLRMPEERAVFDHYSSLPRTRAQEFLRNALLLGFAQREVFHEASLSATGETATMKYPVASPSVAGGSPPQRPSVVPAPPAPAPAASAFDLPDDPVAARVAAPVLPSVCVASPAPPGGSARLQGFFGDK